MGCHCNNNNIRYFISTKFVTMALIKTKGDILWMDVTSKAAEIYAFGIFKIYRKERILGQNIMIMIKSYKELNAEMDRNLKIYIEVGKMNRGLSAKTAWAKATKKTIDGFVYVKCADLNFL